MASLTECGQFKQELLARVCVSKVVDLCGGAIPASLADGSGPLNDPIAQPLPFGSFEVNSVLPNPILVYPFVLFFCPFLTIGALSGIKLPVNSVIPFWQAVPRGQTDLAVGNRIPNLHPACCALVPILGLIVRFNLLASNRVCVVACESFCHLCVDRVVIPPAFRQIHEI
jgi:hypothetical protein